MDNNPQFYQLKFPLVGIRSDGEPFQYLPLTSEKKVLSFAIYNWFVNRSILNLAEQVDLLVPFFLKTRNPHADNMQGTITAIEPNRVLKTVEHKLIFPDTLIDIVPVEDWNLQHFLAQFSQPAISVLDLLFKLLKDTVLLKSGVRIYLKHLRAYFSRISLQAASEYLNLNTLVLSDIEQHVISNEKYLKNLMEEVRTSLKKIDDIPLVIHLEDLREKIESEIPFSLFSLAFNEHSPTGSANLMDLLNPRVSNQSLAYLQAVKLLEKRLYVNYNTIVLIYSYALDAMYSPLD